MANNCNIKKYKGVINNENLVPYGTLRVKACATNSFGIGSYVEGNTVKDLTQNFTTPSGVNQVTVARTSYSTGATVVGVTKEDVIDISDKYNLAYFSGRPFIFDVEQINYMPHLKFADNMAVDKDLTVITTDNTTLISFGMSHVPEENPKYPNTSKGLIAMRHFPNLEYFSAIGYPNIGDLKDLGKCTKLKTITMVRVIKESTVEDFVATMRGAGKTENSVGILLKQMFSSSGITFNGERIPGSAGSPNVKLTWTASTITVGEVTINNSDVIN